MKTPTPLLFLPLILALPACGGSGGGGATTPPPDPAITADPAVINMPNTSRPAPQYFSPEVTNIILVGSSGAYDFKTDYGTVSRYAGIGSSGQMIYGQAASGSRGAIYYFFDIPQTFVERVGVTTFPDGAAPEYSGSYGAVISRLSDSVAWAFITSGTATLSADFETMTVSGTITGRMDQAGGTYADVTLAETSIVNGGFSGAATGGGKLTPAPDFTDNGAYQGMITGAEADELIGTLYLRHLGSPFTEEYGVFLTGEVTPP